jgi:hypothetical protein
MVAVLKTAVLCLTLGLLAHTAPVKHHDHDTVTTTATQTTTQTAITTTTVTTPTAWLTVLCCL